MVVEVVWKDAQRYLMSRKMQWKKTTIIKGRKGKKGYEEATD
jgi:hypothetical protein